MIETYIASIVVAAIAIILAFFVVPYLRKIGALNTSHVKNADNVLQLAKLILTNLNMSPKNKELTTKIFDITQIAVRYVEQTMKDQQGTEKKEHAIEVTMDLLKEMNIVIDNNTLKLIEIGIEAAVNLLDPKK